MTSSGTAHNSSYTGDVDIIDTDKTMDNISSGLSQNDSRSGNTITLLMMVIICWRNSYSS